MNNIFLLLVIFRIKHFLADFILQGQYMLGKFKGGTEWMLPLALHSAVHSFFTLFIAVVFKPELAFLLAMFDFTIHFTMDRIKASPNMLGRFKYLTGSEMVSCLQRMKAGTYWAEGPKKDDFIREAKNKLKSNKYFWWSLGLDQDVHAYTHYAIIYWLVS